MKEKGLEHGIWSGEGNDTPPDTIESTSTGSWQSESEGVATGTEGYVLYATSSGDVRIHWDNPYIGSNGLNITVPNGYTYNHGDISGNNAHVTINFLKDL
uniref:hypothetical protein n=1 Tax=Okeania sp. SIO2F4 TaxID=2607790 RepID=UPI0034146926